MSSAISTTFKHTLIYSASGLLGKAIGFVMLPVYAHYLRGEGYGIIGMIDVVLSVLTLLIGYGIQGAMSRFYYDKNEELERKKLISTAIILMFLLVTLVSLPVLLFSEEIAFLAFGTAGLGFYITLTIFIFIAGMTEKSAEMYILIRQKSIFYVCLSLSKLIIGLSLNIYLIVYLKLGVLGYLYSGLVVSTIFTVIIHSYAFFNTGFHFVKNDAKEILRFSLPLLPGYIAMFIRSNMSRVLLRTYLGLTPLGAFEMLFKFSTLLGVLVVEPFSKIWGIKRFEIADTEHGPDMMARVYTVFFSAMLFFGLVLGLEIPIILKILTPPEFWLDGPVVGLAVLSEIIIASYYHFFFGLLYSKKTYVISIVQIVTSFANLILALLLVKQYGILGAVIVSCLTNIFQCLLAYKLATPYYKIPFDWKRLTVIISFATVSFFLIEQVKLSEHEGVSKWLINIISQPLGSLIEYVHLDTIRNGKLLAYSLSNIPLLAEGLVKFTLSFVFIIGLIAGNIISPKKIWAIVKEKSIVPMLNTSLDKK